MAIKLPSFAFLANESVKKALIDISTLAISGVVCVVGSTLLLQRMGSHNNPPVVGATASEVKPEETKEAPPREHEEKKQTDHAKPDAAADGKSPKEGNGLHLALKPVIVNLADPTMRRYAKVTFTLDLKNESVKGDIQNQEPVIYDTLIKVLGNYYYKDINTSVGKESMKEEVKLRLNASFHDGIVGVFITEMIVQ